MIILQVLEQMKCRHEGIYEQFSVAMIQKYAATKRGFHDDDVFRED